MRISVEEGDPGHKTYLEAMAECSKILIFFNGKRMDHCVSADEGSGEIVRACFDENGVYVVDLATMTVKTETLRGTVRIVRVHPTPASAHLWARSRK